MFNLNNFKVPRVGCVDATLRYHGVWLQVLMDRDDRAKDRQVLNKEEHNLGDALFRDINRIYSEPGEKLRDWLLRLGWLEVRNGVTVPVDSPEGCTARCFKCSMYEECVIQKGKKTESAV